MKIFPLGACTIEYTPKGATSAVLIELTKKDTDTTFATTNELFNIEMDQLSGPYKSYVMAGETSFKCTVLLDLEVISALSNLYEKGTTGIAYSVTGKELQVGKLKIHPMSESGEEFDIVGPKVSCQVNTNIAYKVEGKAECELIFTFAADDDKESETFGKIFTIGKYTKLA